jgi:putative SOS response-associated peptidase YedK
MCGRYASSRKPADLVEEFEIRTSKVDEALAPDYNVAPTKPVYAVMERSPSPRDAEEPEPPERQLRVLTWGLVPSWAKDPSIGNRMINARMETVAEKPAYKRAFASRRCLLPADGYFEWYPTQVKGKSGKPLKQPFFIHPTDGGVLAMAGLYEIWRDPDRSDDDPDRFRWTCTVLTTEAEDAVGHIHDRMPLMVERDRWGAWLDPRASARDDLLSLLVPAAPGRLEAFPVSTDVNNVRNNGPSLVEPIPADDALV